MWRQTGCTPWNMALKKFSVVVRLSAIIYLGLQVLQGKAKKALGDNGYRKGYSSHHMWQMWCYCKLLALPFIPKLTALEFVAVVSWENVAISFWKLRSGWWAVSVYSAASTFINIVCTFFSSDSVPGKKVGFTSGMECYRRNYLDPRSEWYFPS